MYHFRTSAVQDQVAGAWISHFLLPNYQAREPVLEISTLCLFADMPHSLRSQTLLCEMGNVVAVTLVATLEVVYNTKGVETATLRVDKHAGKMVSTDQGGAPAMSGPSSSENNLVLLGRRLAYRSQEETEMTLRSKTMRFSNAGYIKGTSSRLACNRY